MNQLGWITIEGFKSIASIQKLKLGAINVLIGANGAGKSNFVQVFSFLRALAEGRVDEVVKAQGGASRLLFAGPPAAGSLQLRVGFREEGERYEISLLRLGNDDLGFMSQTVEIGEKNADEAKRTVQERAAAAARGSGHSEEFDEFVRTHVTRWRVYHLHDTGSTSPLKRTNDLHDNRFLRPDGANLAAYLYFLREKHPNAYAQIRKTIQLVAPFFDNFTLEPDRLNSEFIRLEWRQKGTDAYFNASSLSDGTLRFMALATLFLQPVELRPSIIIVDEPELGLHPYAITILASLVKQAAVDTQVILSTQSPQLLDHFEPEDVLVAERVNGATELRRLDAERLAVWLEDYSLGQLWEKNELGGRPASE